MLTPDEFLKDLITHMNTIKVPVVILLFIIGIIQLASSAFVGGNDNRAAYSRIAWIFFIAALLFSGDKIIDWMYTAFGR